MPDPHATVTVSVHATPEAIFSALARVFPVTAHDKSRWVQVPSDGVTVTFYAEHATTTDDATAE
jgi:hypothetical protein